MASFLRVGNEWLNLDHVERIESFLTPGGGVTPPPGGPQP
jgi:hypothetical protein